MKYIILAMAFVSLLPWAAFAQLQPRYAPCGQCNANLPVYGAPLVFQTHSIVSDYGMRVVAEGSRFHQGVDYGAHIYYNRWDPISGKGIKESSVRLAQRAEGAVKDLQTAGALKVYAILSERMQWAKDVFA